MSLGQLSLFNRAEAYASKVAIIDEHQYYTYEQLLLRSRHIARCVLKGNEDLQEIRIAFMIAPGYDYTATQWGIWQAGGIAVPLCPSHPLPALEHVLQDSQAEILIVSEAYKAKVQPLLQQCSVEFYTLEELQDMDQDPTSPLPSIPSHRKAMIIYTSGTTQLPKGVVSTHDNLEAQLLSLSEAWQWQPNDHILNVLPLHHVHGIVNILLCALWNGATCEFAGEFSPTKVWDKFSEGRINVFMAVPTVYYQLLQRYHHADAEKQQLWSDCLQGFRLMVSGSAALPVNILEQWREISGHTLLERYGMTEIGMALSNPYEGERRPGHVGQALPKVEVRLVNENGNLCQEKEPGEIQVKSPCIFQEYWQKPEATQEAFTDDGWFKTGDIALVEQGSYKILGRNSVDIIKSGGYKISALEIEEVLRQHPQVKECAVVGIADEKWGECVAAALIWDTGEAFALAQFKEWAETHLPSYKIPSKVKLVEALPRNAMGKVTKNELKKEF
ncbi:acyl-CoA synthetase [Rapidithrix thailandica]|uniref:Acyl-CoA synthetase n=1 Tax=Rapidithrix thailandica TaxID=413964 RepID=A0AAW9RTG7_9BACT